MTGLIIAAVYVAFTVVMVLALTYSGQPGWRPAQPGETPGQCEPELHVTPGDEMRGCVSKDDADPWLDAVDAMPDVTATFAHILAEHSERTET